MRWSTFQIELLLNRTANGLVALESAAWWYAHCSPAARVRVFAVLMRMVRAAEPTSEDAEAAVDAIELDDTHPVRKLLHWEPLESGLQQMGVQAREHRLDAFKAVMLTFRNADLRRRETECREGCEHWWHGDLTAELSIRRALGRRRRGWMGFFWS